MVDGRAGRFLRWWGLFGAGDVIFSRSARGLCYASFLCPRPACGVISLAGDIKKNKKRRAVKRAELLARADARGVTKKLRWETVML